MLIMYNLQLITLHQNIKEESAFSYIILFALIYPWVVLESNQ
jgi:hypothetical protein